MSNQSAETFMAHSIGIAPVDGATGVSTGAVLDMTHFRQALIVLSVGVISGTVAMKIQGSATSGGSYADITGWNIVTLAATADGSTSALRLRMNATALPFLKAIVTVTGGAASFISVVYLPYDAVNTDVTFGTYAAVGDPSAS